MNWHASESTAALEAGPGASPFRSFWMGGYEGADHLNSRGVALDPRRSTGHAARTDEDYAALARFGLRTIRETIGWRASVDRHGRLEPGELLRTAHLAKCHGLQVIWSLHHYGLPDGVDFFAEDLAARFADFCESVAKSLRGVTDEAPIYQPINEISFLSWAAGCTDLIHPYRAESAARGYDLKCCLVRAALAGCDALRAVDPRARLVHTDPIIHVVGTEADPVAGRDASALCESQYEAWDMLCGRLESGLGGAPHYLDIPGLNYYHGNQWEHPSNGRLSWHLGDPRRRPLEDLIGDVVARYGRPVIVAETGHVGAGRSLWLDEVARGALVCESRGIPLQGVCLYPLVDRADWEQTSHWHESGLWNVMPSTLDRVLHAPTASSLDRWQPRVPAGSAAAATELLSHIDSVHSQGTAMTTLIVFSHLRWDFVYQRPQQLLSRLAERFKIIVVEEPVPNAERRVLERLQPCAGVEVLRPHVTGQAMGFHDEHIPALRTMLSEYLESHALGDYWLWFYTPMAVPLATGLAPRGVVYDCMDELSAFRNAPRQLLQRENALYQMADLVFTGGRSLYEAKRARHPSVHCFPSSVDSAHFASALRGDDFTADTNPTPRLGYCGVIDERVDLDIVAAMADARPTWQIDMVGPVVKIDPASLPQRANIHWLGQRDYADLPALMSGWDVCLMPFALNEATRFISPTKTLEYMAAGRPVVSTPIRDVVTPYAGIVAIADGAEAFIAACDATMAQTPAERVVAAAARAAVVAGTSWDLTAARMADLIDAQAARSAGTATRTVIDQVLPDSELPATAVA